MIKTITLDGTIQKVTLGPEPGEYYVTTRYVYVKNNSGSSAYASLFPDKAPGEDGVTRINPLECTRIQLAGADTIYIFGLNTGTGTVELYTDSSQISPYSDEGVSSGGGTPSTISWNNVTDRPTINGHELNGNMSSSDLGIHSTWGYNNENLYLY